VSAQGFLHGGLEVGHFERFGEGYCAGERPEIVDMVDFFAEKEKYKYKPTNL
jgi:hypothetical protein